MCYLRILDNRPRYLQLTQSVQARRGLRRRRGRGPHRRRGRPSPLGWQGRSLLRGRGRGQDRAKRRGRRAGYGAVPKTERCISRWRTPCPLPCPEVSSGPRSCARACGPCWASRLQSRGQTERGRGRPRRKGRQARRGCEGRHCGAASDIHTDTTTSSAQCAVAEYASGMVTRRVQGPGAGGCCHRSTGPLLSYKWNPTQMDRRVWDPKTPARQPEAARCGVQLRWSSFVACGCALVGCGNV